MVVGGSHKTNKLVRLEVLTEVTIKTTIFWDAIPCSHVEIYQHSGEMYNIHLLCWFLVQVISGPCGWSQYIPFKHQHMVSQPRRELIMFS
jgi:hypothetical protein